MIHSDAPQSGTRAKRALIVKRGTCPEFEIICIGAAKFDAVAAVEDFPREDERILADTLQDAIGGPAVTAAVAIARLGVPVAFCGVIGRDSAGDRIMERLEQERIGTRWVTRSGDIETARSMNIVARRNATRTIITVPAPAARSRRRRLAEGALDAF